MAPDLRDEIDFRELLKKPSTLFGYVFLYVFVVLVGLGIYYAQHLTVVGKNSIAPVVFEDSSRYVQDIPLQRPRELPPVDVMEAARPTDELLSRGSELFAANCASCHGTEGRGDGPAGLQLNPPPRNFHSAQGWTNGPSIAGIYTTLEEGIVRNGMAAYNYMPPIDRFALVHYVRTFVPDPPPPNPEALQALERNYQLSRGLSVPGQIPVRKATDLILRQNQNALAAIDRAVERSADDGSAGARILHRHTHDRDRAVRSFLARTGAFPGPDEFRAMVLADPLGLGFSADVASLTREEWSTLHDYVASLRAGAGSPSVRMF